MLEIRFVNDGQGGLQLQQRTRQPVVDASGAFCGFGEWSDWSSVPVVHGAGALRSAVDVFDTRDSR
jgi:hypothetical protein